MEYSEMRSFLKEIHKTDDEMQMMWDFCIQKNHPLICQINKCGKSWSDLNVYVLRSLEKEYLKLNM